MPTPPDPDATSASPPVPSRLIVVGSLSPAASLIGEQLLTRRAWDEVLLLDLRGEIHRPTALDAVLPVTRLQVVTDHGAVEAIDATGRPAPIPPGDAVVYFAVRHRALATMARWLVPQLGPGSILFDAASDKVTAMATFAEVDGDMAAFGLHPLFGPTVTSIEGQTFVISPSPRFPDAHRWLSEAIDEAGAFATEMSAEDHDRAMAYVETAVHQSLLAFADVVGASGVDIERDLWECRTPQFEALLALATQVLGPTQQQTTAAIQVSSSGPRIAEEVLDAHERLRSAIGEGTETAIEQYIGEVREPFTGQLFERMQQASALALAATQMPRSIVAGARQTGDLLGVSPKGRPDRLRVGHVEQLRATTFRMRNLLVGPRGGAALLGPYDAGARQLGLRGTPEAIELGLGNVDMFRGPELDRLLDEWLGSFTVDIRLRVGASIAHHGIEQAGLDRDLVATAQVIGDTVWRGSREVIVRCELRADRSADGLAQEFQRSIDQLFSRPIGSVLPLAHGGDRSRDLTVGHIEPSSPTARDAVTGLQELVPTAVRQAPSPSVPELLAALTSGAVDLAVVPIWDSLVGLIEDGLDALGAASGTVRGMGVVDVPPGPETEGSTTRFLVLARVADGPDANDTPALIGNRHAWLLRNPETVPVSRPGPHHDEIITGPTGHRAWLTTDPERFEAADGVTPLGSFPWFPATPMGPVSAPAPRAGAGKE